jgi:hypothetical protein
MTRRFNAEVRQFHRNAAMFRISVQSGASESTSTDSKRMRPKSKASA